MIFRYDIIVPLTYNRFSILSNDPDSELRYEMKQCCEEEFRIVFRTYEIPRYKDGYDFEDIVKISLYENTTDDKQDASNWICEINGMLVDDEIYARKFSEEMIDRICKRLSLVFIKHNANRHLYQPRVEAMWSKAFFNRCEYAPFLEAKQKALEGDDKHKTIYLEDRIYLRGSVQFIATTMVPPAEIHIGEWLSTENEVVEFLMNEYYSALGTENIKSKFFHLFAIIEFCEKEYENHNGASRLLSDDEVDKILTEMKRLIDAEKREKILSSLKNSLLRLNDTGREGKLENILKWMDIKTYKHLGAEKTIDKKMLSEITKLRNKSFHGTKENLRDVEREYANAVEKLLYIDEKILDFVMKDSFQDKGDGSYLIRGKR